MRHASRIARVWGVLAAGALAALAPATSTAQDVANPVYLDDAPVAPETIARALERLERGETTGAARTLGELILGHGERLIDRGDGSGAAVTVRRRVNDLIVSRPGVLDAYRRLYEPDAERALASGEHDRVWRDLWLTRSGAEASLRRAQVLIESAHPHAGIHALERLIDHPDAGALAARGAALARSAGALIQDDPGARRTHKRWARLAGAEPAAPLRARRAPQAEVVSGIGGEALGRGAPDLLGIVSAPLGTARLTPSGELDPEAPTNDGTGARPRPWSAPAVSGDALVTNDGVTISCLDRFTLRTRWRYATSRAGSDRDRSNPVIRSRLARTIEDLSSVTIHRGEVYAATGLARTGDRTEDDRIVALDIESGALLRETTLSEIDPALERSSVRGAILVVGDTLVIGARSNQRRERLVTIALVGIDRRTFEHRWTRPIASAGSLPFQQVGRIAHAGVADRGVVYWSDAMGVVAAVEGATGRLLWARAIPSEDIYARTQRDPWTVTHPVVVGDLVYALGADGAVLHELDARTGELRASKRAVVSGEGAYLIRAGSGVGVVGRLGITLHDSEGFAAGAPRSLTPTGSGREPIRGRVRALGDALLIPITSGFALADTTRTGFVETVDLERSGMMLALEGQVVVIDENEASVFLSWDTARSVLSERIARGDASSAVTLAELAHRAGKREQIIPSVDRAVELVGDGRGVLASRLFEVVRSMLDTGDDASTLGPEQRAQLVERLGSLARTPGQVLTHKLERGAWLGATGRAVEASRIYHGVLDDDRLRSVMWVRDGVRLRAEIEARGRLDALVSREGRRVCAAFDEPARVELELARAGDDPARPESVARRYPWSIHAPRAWDEAARAHTRRGAPMDAAHAARSGLRAAQRLESAGEAPDKETVASLASTLIGSLIDAHRSTLAARRAGSLAARYPWLVLELHGERVGPRDLAARISPGAVRPTIAARLERSRVPTLVTGSPVHAPRRADPGRVVLYAPQLASASLVEFGPGEPRTIWTRAGSSPEPPVALIQDGFQTVLLWAPGPGAEGGVLESIETASGRTRWRFENLHGAVREGSSRIGDTRVRRDRRVESPIDGPVARDQLLGVSDGSVVVVCDRIGRALCVDALSGRVLWREDLDATRVHDIDLELGVLGVVGRRVVDAQDDEPGTDRASVSSINARRGETIQTLGAALDSPRWVRVSDEGTLLVGTSSRLVALDTRTGSVDWSVRHEALRDSIGAWVLPSRIVVLAPDASLWGLDPRTGALDAQALSDQGRVVQRGWVEVGAGGEGTVVAAMRGVAVFDARGAPVARDARVGEEPWADAGWGRSRLVLASRAREMDDTRLVHIRVVDQGDARTSDMLDIEIPGALRRDPTLVELAGGAVIVGMGEVSVVVRGERD